MDENIYEFLTDADKAEIIDSHIRTNESNIYTFELNKMQAALDTPVDQSRVDLIDQQIAAAQQKITALKAEKATLNLE